MSELEEVKKELELQEKKVNEKISPILKLYYEDKITKKELVERLAEAFYELENNWLKATENNGDDMMGKKKLLPEGG